MEGERQLDNQRSIIDDADFSQVIEIYKVRCNLMKCGKPAEPSPRNISVCESASDVLDGIVKYLVFER
jgi:hypothetical protein